METIKFSSLSAIILLFAVYTTSGHPRKTVSDSPPANDIDARENAESNMSDEIQYRLPKSPRVHDVLIFNGTIKDQNNISVIAKRNNLTDVFTLDMDIEKKQIVVSPKEAVDGDHVIQNIDISNGGNFTLEVTIENFGFTIHFANSHLCELHLNMSNELEKIFFYNNNVHITSMKYTFA